MSLFHITKINCKFYFLMLSEQFDIQNLDRFIYEFFCLGVLSSQAGEYIKYMVFLDLEKKSQIFPFSAVLSVLVYGTSI